MIGDVPGLICVKGSEKTMSFEEKLSTVDISVGTGKRNFKRKERQEVLKERLA